MTTAHKDLPAPTLSNERIDWIANAHCPDGAAHPYNVKCAIKAALSEVSALAALARPEPASTPAPCGWLAGSSYDTCEDMFFRIEDAQLECDQFNVTADEDDRRVPEPVYRSAPASAPVAVGHVDERPEFGRDEHGRLTAEWQAGNNKVCLGFNAEGGMTWAVYSNNSSLVTGCEKLDLAAPQGQQSAGAGVCADCNGTGVITATGKKCPCCSTVRAPDKADPAQEAGLDSALYDAMAEQLNDLYACGRVWSAWQVGTMTESDFSIASEDEDIIANFVSAAREAIDAIKAAPAQPAVDLVAAIEAIELPTPNYFTVGDKLAYEVGRNNMRTAAANLVAAHLKAK